MATVVYKPLSHFSLYGKGRCEAMENENKCSVEELLLEHELYSATEFSQSKEKYRKVVQAGIAHWIKDFQQGRIEIKTVDDLKKLIEIDLQLQKDDY